MGKNCGIGQQIDSAHRRTCRLQRHGEEYPHHIPTNGNGHIGALGGVEGQNHGAHDARRHINDQSQGQSVICQLLTDSQLSHAADLIFSVGLIHRSSPERQQKGTLHFPDQGHGGHLDGEADSQQTHSQGCHAQYGKDQERFPNAQQRHQGVVPDAQNQKQGHKCRGESADPVGDQQPDGVCLIRKGHQSLSLAAQYQHCVAQHNGKHDQLRGVPLGKGGQYVRRDHSQQKIQQMGKQASVHRHLSLGQLEKRRRHCGAEQGDHTAEEQKTPDEQLSAFSHGGNIAHTADHVQHGEENDRTCNCI